MAPPYQGLDKSSTYHSTSTASTAMGYISKVPSPSSPRLHRRSGRRQEHLLPRVIMVAAMTGFLIIMSVRLLGSDTNLIVLIDSSNKLLLDAKAAELEITTPKLTEQGQDNSVPAQAQSSNPPKDAAAAVADAQSFELPEPNTEEAVKKGAEDAPNKKEEEMKKDMSSLSFKEQYALFDAPIGILSDTPFESYLERHKEIDSAEQSVRCRRYGYSFSPSNNRDRRIFYGSVIMDEPWEMLEILSAEWYGVLHTMVFIEPTRDIYGKERKTLRLETKELLQSMFGIDNIRIVKFENDDPSVKGDLYLDMARDQILKEWIDMGMNKDDVGYMSNIDDMFMRDYLQAIRYCEVPEFKNEIHNCVYNRVKTFGHSQVYEVSPDCASRTKIYDHPDIMIGACLEGIGDLTKNQKAPRDETGVNRAPGWNCEDRNTEKDIKDLTYPLWSGADMRSLCGGKQVRMRASLHQSYTSFHFRNWFNTARDMRLKYTTEDKLYEKSMDDLGEDMRVTYRCLKDIPDEQNARVKREPGGFTVLKPMTPIYLADEAYRKKVHARAVQKIEEDEKLVKKAKKE